MKSFVVVALGRGRGRGYRADANTNSLSHQVLPVPGIRAQLLIEMDVVAIGAF